MPTNAELTEHLSDFKREFEDFQRLTEVKYNDLNQRLSLRIEKIEKEISENKSLAIEPKESENVEDLEFRLNRLENQVFEVK